MNVQASSWRNGELRWAVSKGFALRSVAHEYGLFDVAGWHMYRHMFTLRCAAQALDLVLKHIRELDFFRDAVDKAGRVTQLIVSHASHAIFQDMALLRISKPGVRKQDFTV